MPFHSAQLALAGLEDEHLKEASWVAESVAGASAYMHGVGYDMQRFKQEVDTIVHYLKTKQQAAV